MIFLTTTAVAAPNSLMVFSSPPTLDLDATQAGNGYLSSFTGSSLAIANSGEVVITDADGTTLDGAVVTLTNPGDGNNEQLFVDNAATIQSTYGITVTANASGHALTLSGTASLANYETALGLVKYDNAAGTPNTDDRVVEVVLNDGGTQSNTAQNRIGINAIPAKDTDGDGVLDEDDLDDDNDGVPDNVEDPCQKTFAYNFSSEGWYTINNNNNNQVGSNPASHSTDPVTGNDGCTISIVGPANENIAGASPTGTNYIVDADPNGGLMYLRSPEFGGLDYRGLLGGTFQYDAYNYRVGYGQNGKPKNPVWINNARATVYIYDIQGNSIRAQSTVTGVQFTNWENGSWNTFAFPIDDATWSGNAALLNNVLADVDYISIQMEFVNGGNTGDCDDVEYYAMDNVVLTSLPSCDNDDDNDGIPNSLDLDSDNDGIYDAVEAGHGQPHTNGTVDGPVGQDGIPDKVQGNGNEGSGNTYYPPILDLDGNDDNGAGANYQTTFTEGDADRAIADSDATLADGDDTDLESATIILGNRPDGTDEGLSVDGNLPAGIVVSNAYDNSDGTLVLSGTAPVARYLAAIQQIVYNNTSENPDATDRTITVVMNDGDVNSNTATATIEVVAVNDAPTAANKTLTTPEETPVVVATTDLGYNDVDEDELRKITINAAPTVGTLFIDANDDNRVDTGEALADNAEVTKIQLDANQLKFLPALDGTGTGYADFDFTVNDGTTDALASNTITFDVTNVNDAPTATDNRVTTPEDNDKVFAVADFGYADVDGNGFNHIRITDLPNNGVLFVDADNDGTMEGTEAVALNQNIAVADIPKLTFKPEPNANGIDYAIFDFLVNDGTDYSIAANTITVDVAPVNDIPTTADKTVTANEDTDYAFVVSDFPYSDTENTPLDHIRLTELPTNGTLFVDNNDDGIIDTGESVTANDDVALTDIPRLKFRPAPDANGAGYDSFKFLVNDGTDYSAAPAGTITVNVDAANDAPTATVPGTQNTNEDTDLVFNDTNGNRISLDDIDGDDQTVSISVTNGVLSLSQTTGLTFTTGTGSNEAAMTFSGSLVNIDNALNGAQFTPTPNYSGTDGQLVISTNDGSLDSGNETIDITVTPVNDAPVTNNGTVVIDADEEETNVPLNLAAPSDVDDAALTITVTSLPTLGALTLANGSPVALNQTLTNTELTGLQYDAPADYDGVATEVDFAYEVSDGDKTAAQTVSFNLSPVNDPPEVTAQSVAEETDEETPLVFNNTNGNALGIADADGDIQTVTITAANGTFTLTQTTGLTFTTGNGSDDVTMEFEGSLSNINSALTGASFRPDADYFGAASVTLSTEDNRGGTDAETIAIDVKEINDAPVLDLDADNSTTTGADYQATFTEGDPDLPIVDSDVRITDVDNPQLTQVTIGLTNRPNGTNEGLRISGTLPSNISVSDTYDNTDGQLTLSGNADLATYEAALRQVVYHNDSENPDEAARTITVVARDGALNSNVGTTTLTIVGVNDAPVANNGGLVTITADEEQEDVPLNLAAPRDADDNDATLVITVAELPVLGTVTLADGTPVTLSQTLTIAQLTSLQYDAPTDYDGTVNPVTFAYSVSDGNETITQKVDFTLSSVNDAPVVIIPADQTTPEDTDLTFSTANGNVIEVDDADGDDQTVVIGVTNGILTLSQTTGLTFVTGGNGTAAMTLSGSLANINAALENADFTPTANYSGSADITLETEDADGASDRRTLGIDVTSVNDLPTATNGKVTTNEDTDYAFAVADFNYTDTENVALDHIEITRLPSRGVLFVDTNEDGAVDGGETITLNQDVPAADIAKLRFRPAADTNGDDYDTFDFLVNDGTDYAAGASTMTIDVDAVNDAPVANNGGDVTIDADEEEENVALNLATPSDVDNDDNTLTIIVTQLPLLGTLTLADGSPVAPNQALTIAELTGLQYDAPADYNGTNTETDFVYTVSDGAETVTQTVNFNLSATNDAPTAANNEVETNEDEAYTFAAADFTASYSDAEGDDFAGIKITGLETAGTLTLDGADVALNDVVSLADLSGSKLVFTPDANQSGDDYATFTFQVADDQGAYSADYTITVDVAPVNDAPVSADLDLTINEDTPYSFLATDFAFADDADGDTFAAVIITGLPNAGSLTYNGNPVTESDVTNATAFTDRSLLSFTPALNEFGNPYASFAFAVRDDAGDTSEPHTVRVEVTSINDLPVVSDVTKAGSEDLTVAFLATNFSDQFSDVDGETLVRIQIKTLPDITEGVVQFNGSDIAADTEIDAADLDQLTFVPATDFNGEVSFAWNGSDGTSYADENAAVTITLAPVADVPVVTNVAKNGTEDEVTTFSTADFTAQFDDADGDPLVSVRITELPTNGTLFLNDEVVAINTEIDAADLATLTLVPDADYVGTVSFGWSGSDGTAYANPAATVNVDFAPQPDAPMVTEVVKDPVDEEQPVIFSAPDFSDRFSDVDGEALAKIQITYLPTNGTLQLNGADVTVDQEILLANLAGLTVVPNEHFFGTDSLGWNGSDGTDYAAEAAAVRLTFRSVQDAPTVSDVAKTAAAGFTMTFAASDFSDQFTDVDNEPLATVRVTSLPTNGTLYLNGVAVVPDEETTADALAQLTYVPTDGYTGPDSFGWNGSDGTDYATTGAQVLIEVLPQEPPVLSDVLKTGDEDETVAFAPNDFIGQFNDPDSDPLAKIQVTSLPTEGTLLLDGVPVEVGDEIEAIDLSKLSFVPPANFHGTVSFGWNGYDGFQYADAEAVVSMTINSIPDQPELSTVEKQGEEDQTLTFTAADFTDQFTDGDGDLLTKVQIVSLPENGTLRLNGVPVAAGDELAIAELDQLTFDPAAHFAGTVSFAWNGYDGTSYAAEPATVAITIGEQNDGMPVATTATFQTDESTTLTASLTKFINDPEGRGVVYATVPVTGPAHGTLTLNADGTFTYVPDADYQGKDTFTYRVCDQGNPSACTEGSVKLIVGEPDDDEDGIPDTVEKGNDPDNPTDTDGDGVPDYQDDDSDNDGIPDGQETGDDPTNPVDTDGDGTPDYRDTDSDNDGLTDTQEAGNDPSNPTDSDDDGVPDYQEIDSDGDGLTDAQEAGDTPAEPTDTDGDGVPNYQDTDSDGDGIPDRQEVGPDPTRPRDTDGDGIPNYQETDSDNDGIPDSQEDVITIYEGFSPNSDSKNDKWYIDGIEDYPENTVQIFNRWGNKVYEISGYNNDDRAWSSESSVGLILGDTQVPDGTYFYIIDLKDGKKPRSGYVIVHRQ